MNPMSRSPRRSLRVASTALDDLDDVIRRYPEARDELRAVLGDELLAEVEAARGTLERALQRIEAIGSDSMTVD